MIVNGCFVCVSCLCSLLSCVVDGVVVMCFVVGVMGCGVYVLDSMFFGSVSMIGLGWLDVVMWNVWFRYLGMWCGLLICVIYFVIWLNIWW